MSKTAHAVPELPPTPFRDPEGARRNLAKIAERVPAGVSRAIPALLADVPDPDAALNLFERLTESAPAELFRAFDRDRVLAHYALAVFGYSHFLGETLIQNSDLFHMLQRDKILDHSRSREEYREAFARFRSRSFDTDLALLLARFKRREYVRIMLRDVLGTATLADTTNEISSLADVLIEEALRETDAAFRSRYGPPQHFDAEGRLTDIPVTVVSLGKLGGNELNYSSDIDLLFLFGDGEDAGTTSISVREYFVRLAQTVTDTLSRITKDGSAFRVDLRLRPQGGEGEPAIGLSQALQYYGNSAADWELQAMIKARQSAGDVSLARKFIRAVQPFVYREQLNFAAIETALRARDRIGARRRVATAKGGTIDVKLDRGGIRDIEFLVQCLQRVYGGNERWLRSGGTLFSLQKLHDKEHLAGRDFNELTTAYEFLRKLEHRLQLRQGQQTHKLPKSREQLEVLARSMASGQVALADDLEQSVRRRMAAVAEIYNRIIHHQQWQQQRDTPEFHLESAEPGRDQSERQIMARLAADAPALHEVMSSANLKGPARRNLLRFLSAAFTSSERYATVARAPEAVQGAVEILRLSDYLTDILTRHPEEIAGLASRGGGAAPNGAGQLFEQEEEEQRAFGDPVFAYLASAEVGHNEKMSLLRRHYRHRVFASGARDVVENRNVYESLAENSAAADEAIAAALAIAGQPPGFAVLALGRLGTSEFDLLSDADLLFVRDESLDAAAATHAAEQLMHTLSAYTREGTVFPVDARLRPRGAEGELVMSVAYLGEYFRREAQAWEALSFTKLRHVAGNVGLFTSATANVSALLARFSADEGFIEAVREMRSKLDKSDPGEFSLKTGAGGMYDVDFLVSALAVKHRVALRGNTRQRLRALRYARLLGDSEFELLDRAAEFYRVLDHAIRLVTGRRRRALPVGEQARSAIEELAARMLGGALDGDVAAQLERTSTAVRALYEHVMV
ncbi:MAG TPA: putative nucleotidyltransferase substrate binding domain-containing protein [Terriglobales bacterium]|nr:putative nucleotidyltransferase substrate binding domain-containing protein [Terriglobales bacterium]